jgi:hypothetical protein
MPQPVASLSAIALEVEAGSSDALNQRRTRRVYLGPEVLRNTKLVAGHWVIVKAKKSSGGLGWVVGQVWPRVGLDDDSEFGLAGNRATHLVVDGGEAVAGRDCYAAPSWAWLRCD